MATSSTLRISRELAEIQKGTDLSLAVTFNEGDVHNVRALIVGPPETPYEFGFYEFSVTFTGSYPTLPPKVKSLTTDTGRTRFGPNIYQSGLICLSILGTWRGQPGEEWSTAQGIESILISIQSLMCANPYENEPGFDKTPATDIPAINYAAKIRHENIRITVIKRLEGILGIEGPKEEAPVKAPVVDTVKASAVSPVKAPVVPSVKAPVKSSVKAPVKTPAKTPIKAPEPPTLENGGLVSSAPYFPPGHPPMPPVTATIAATCESVLGSAKGKGKIMEAYVAKVAANLASAPASAPSQAKYPHELFGSKAGLFPNALLSGDIDKDDAPEDYEYDASMYAIHDKIEPSKDAKECVEDPMATSFGDLFKRRFLWYFDSYIKTIDVESKKHKVGEQFRMTRFESARVNGMVGQYQYSALKKRLEVIRAAIDRETESWATEGFKAYMREAGQGASLQRTFVQISEDCKRSGSSSIELSLVDRNPFLWRVTVFGRPSTNLDGSAINLRIYFSGKFPAEQPRVVVLSELFHHRISATGNVLCYIPQKPEDIRSHIDAIVSAIEEEEPAYDPRTMVNPDASTLLWGDENQKRSYYRKLRRSVQDSMDLD